MSSSITKIILGTLIVVVAATAFGAPASAKRHHRRLVGAVLKPGYVGAPGFAGGPPGPVVPMLFDYPAPISAFVGIPILSGLGL